MLIFLAVWLIPIPINFFLCHILNRCIFDDMTCSKISISDALFPSLVPVINILCFFILIRVCIGYLFELISKTEMYERLDSKFKGTND